MSHENILERERAALVVIDVQEAFRPAVLSFDRVVKNVGILIRGFRELGLPVMLTEQYPKGLGNTVPEIAEFLKDIEPIEKLCFSARAAEPFAEALERSGRDQVLICGIEAHVCVSQTAHDLLDRGEAVQVAGDATSSRTRENLEIGLRKMEAAGAVITSTETALFELLGEAGTPEFKAVQKLVL